MNNRQQDILKAVVELYTETALPIGSQLLLDTYDFNVSSATLRNDLASLEEAGYLYQPHTSAGRIPTTQGYRAYVEDIMGEELLSKREQQKLQSELLMLRAKQARMGRTTAKLLSALSGNLAVTGVFDKEEFYDFGMRELIENPEFQEIDELARLVETLDSLDERLEGILGELTTNETRIYIGEENPIREISNCSMIIAPFENSEGRGILAIIGPKRMHYAKNKSLVEYVQRLLSDQKMLTGAIVIAISPLIIF
jgi:transcriptional regulator of heat shock response